MEERNIEDILSDREIQVIKALSDGSTYKEAGLKLNISPSTINMHNYSAFKKIGVKNIVGAINYVNKYHGE